jgi:hypothetical protein
MQRFDFLKMEQQALFKRLRQNGYPVFLPFAIPNGDLIIIEIDIFYRSRRPSIKRNPAPYNKPAIKR